MFVELAAGNTVGHFWRFRQEGVCHGLAGVADSHQ